MSNDQKSLRDIIKAEYKKCLENPMYFMKKYVKIQHPKRGTIPFELYPFQDKSLQEIIDNDYNIILKSRQLGITTLSSAYSLWLMIFHSDKNILCISITQETSKEIVTRVRFANDNLPSWLKVPCVEDNRLSLRLKNGSQIKAVSSSGTAGRSSALSMLIIDEAAFIDNIDEIWTSAQSTLSTGGKAIVLSTPNGVGNFFHRTWVDAEAKKNKFHTIRLPWQLHPERDQTWRDEQNKLLGPKMAAQECDCDFATSGNTVIDVPILDFYKQTKVRDPIETRGMDKSLWLWEYPDYTRSYLVCADVARGDGADYSAFHVIDVESFTQVAEYKGQIGTKDYGNMLVNVATEYNNALLVIENLNIGWGAIQQVLDRKYPNLFYSSADLKYVDVEHQMTNRIHSSEKKMTPGFTTTSVTRQLIISRLESYMREKSINVQSVRTIDELYTFIWNNGKAEAMRNYNDDLVMSFAIGLWIRDTALKLRQQSIDLTRNMLGNINRTESQGSPVFTTKTAMAHQSWEMPTGANAQKESLTWLL
jgi:hypothetical protein